VATGLKAKRGVDDILENGAQITLVHEDAMLASPRKLARMGYKVSAVRVCPRECM
jgi:hypothetical protein